ncbi:hypothetical protein Rhopal_003405-T1 [Rhodotorula paludigena]|uniref:VASt domain-containing protein n=1 Tax=Rhodotorula paludigena TaxID=86838 RepID=A0AAV5GMA9_9BASI|nr:hypothetical protein Rhopal_003405-T1 [Rhodotorula paludigena]
MPTSSSPPSDSSEPVLVSRPPSPPPDHSAPPLPPAVTDASASRAEAGDALTPTPAQQEPKSQFSRDDASPPPVNTHKDTGSETVKALEPKRGANATEGLGRPGREQVAHLSAGDRILGGAEGVVGEAYGAKPEWIAKVKRAPSSQADGLVTASENDKPDAVSKGPVSAGSEEQADGDAEDGDDDGPDDDRKSGQPKWFRKVKAAASSIKEKASSTNSRERSDSLDAPPSPGASGGGIRRARTRSIGQRSAVTFQLDDGGSKEDGAPSRGEAQEAMSRVVTDRDGNPVPLEVGTSADASSAPSNTPGAVVVADGEGEPVAAGNASTTTSVKNKILETFDVEPSTSQEKFHEIFDDQDEELIEDYRCALVRDILVQGKLYVSENFLSFRANILGWQTSLQLPWTEIVSIEKRMTAKVIPNAIEIRTLHATHTFASFINRDGSFALITAIWKHVHPEAHADRAAADAAKKEEKRRRRRSASTSSHRSDLSNSLKKAVRSASGTSSETDSDGDDKSEISFEDENGRKKRHRFKLRSSLASLKLSNIRSRDAPGASASTSGADHPTEAEKVKAQAQAKASAGAGPGAGDGEAHAPTTYDGPEYKNVALDIVLPTRPRKAYKLCFLDETFLRAFWEGKEGLKEVEIGPWKALDGAAAQADDCKALKRREVSYLKPLNAPVGPKQTHCNIVDENERVDEDSYISTVTTTKTPDVPSGDNFSTVTRTVFTWAEGGGCRVRVTTEVEWTKVNRLLRSVIERGAVDGQIGYHKDLEAAVRAHIAANAAEYAIAGSAPSANSSDVKSTDTAAGEPGRGGTEPTSSAPSSSSDGGFLDSLLGISPLAAGLLVLVLVLALTNLFTLLSLRKQAAAVRAVRIGSPSEVASAMERVLGQFSAQHAKRAVGPSGEPLAHAVAELAKAARLLESQARALADRSEGLKDYV